MQRAGPGFNIDLHTTEQIESRLCQQISFRLQNDVGLSPKTRIPLIWFSLQFVAVLNVCFCVSAAHYFLKRQSSMVTSVGELHLWTLKNHVSVPGKSWRVTKNAVQSDLCCPGGKIFSSTERPDCYQERRQPSPWNVVSSTSFPGWCSFIFTWTEKDIGVLTYHEKHEASKFHPSSNDLSDDCMKAEWSKCQWNLPLRLASRWFFPVGTMLCNFIVCHPIFQHRRNTHTRRKRPCTLKVSLKHACLKTQ